MKSVSTFPASRYPGTSANGAQPARLGLDLRQIPALWQTSGLKQKLLFTLVMIAVYRLGILIPVWGVNADAITHLVSNQLLGFLDMFSGGALTSVSVLALGIGPYITASIMLQLLTVVIPRLEEMQKEEGEAGRRKIGQYTRYFTVVLALLQATLVMRFIASVPGAIDPSTPAWLFYPAAVLSLMAGSLFTLWLAELITDRGVGNGASLLIFVGILSRIPSLSAQTATFVGSDPQKSFGLVALMLIYLLTIGLIIILQEATRNIPIVSAKRQVGRRVMGGQSTFIPFKINPAGVMPIIFTFAVMAFPSTLLGLLQQSQAQPGQMAPWLQTVVGFYGRYLSPGTWAYGAIEFALIIFFTFFYSSIIPSMQPREIAESLKKYGSAIPGIKPGRPTAEKLEQILSRTTMIGAAALAGITLLATSATSLTGITTLQGLGSTSLIILVGVALDTVNQIRVHLLARQYEGFLK